MRPWVWSVALLVSACTAPDAVGPPGPPVYLALGDSIAFGYNPLAKAAPASGYAEVLGARRAVEVVNASCPGEASGGFISPTGNDNHCRENRVAYPLHVAYDGPQLGFAVDFLANNSNTTLVTIDLGGNDISKLNDLCAGDLGCVLGGFMTMLQEYTRNLNFIFEEIRRVYDGPLVALTIYNPYPAESSTQYGLERINAVLATQVARFDGIVADGMEGFRTASGNDPCGAGFLIVLPDGTCDAHPSDTGDEVLADVIEAALARPR